MGDAWESDWSGLDRQARGRLRRAALRGREVGDPREAALVAAFARSKANDRRGLQLAVHALVIAGVTAALILNLQRGGGLAPVYGALLVLDLATLAFFLGSRRRLLEAAELNERVASSRSWSSSADPP
jgi:hypothetical protein